MTEDMRERAEKIVAEIESALDDSSSLAQQHRDLMGIVGRELAALSSAGTSGTAHSSVDMRIEAAYEFARQHDNKHPHQTEAVMVWADIDKDIADTVRYLNTIPGVRTQASCQGNSRYRAYVMASWPAEKEERLRQEFEVEILGENWGYLHLKGGDSRVSEGGETWEVKS